MSQRSLKATPETANADACEKADCEDDALSKELEELMDQEAIQVGLLLTGLLNQSSCCF